MKTKYFFILTIIFFNVNAQVKSKYDREMEALENFSQMREDENKVTDLIYSYKTYVRNYINQNLKLITSIDYRRISNFENTLWNSIMENRNQYSFESHFYSAARKQLEYYKATLVATTNEAIMKTSDNDVNAKKINNEKRKATLFNPYETIIDGQFKGWDGENIYKTKEGAIWQQVDNIQINHFEYSPKVQLYENEGTIFMKVEGTKYYVKVKRLK